ncbi:STAS domain-containing protein [Chloroflexus sp.]|uniref:STAS domain-containing protein n=1 Tax=Chloroflexus sp. TaxID=1904827 RepID=UPI002604F149|nr:STAS domain-containing protein [uncultured Chloroflexus sp.]
MQSWFAWLTEIRSSDEDTVRRGKTTIILALIMIVLAILAIPISIITGSGAGGNIAIASGIIAYIIAIAVTRAGFVNVGGLILIAFIILPTIAPTIINTSATSPYTSFFYLNLSLLVAGLTVSPPLIWAILTINLISGTVARQLGGTPLFSGELGTVLDAAAIFLQFSTALFTFVGSMIFERTLRETRRLREEAKQSASRLAQLNDQLEQQVSQRTAALQTALEELERRAAEQARLLAENEQQRQAIRELSVPVLPVRSTTLVMPLIGALDTARLTDMQQQALRQIEHTGARELLIDVTGVPVIDTQVARSLIQIVEAARLMGAQVTLVGIRPEVAQTLVTLGIDLHTIRAFSTLQAALSK